jgi:hypothetical protein
MTTDGWDKEHTPLSLFEYITITVFMCSLNLISNDFNRSYIFIKSLKTKGCIFDFTVVKEHRRIVVSNSFLCNICKDRMKILEKDIEDKTGMNLDFYRDVQNFLSRQWIGSLKRLILQYSI